jgi:hypothetical protein
MKTNKLSHTLFVFAVIAALVLAAVPMASAHAMSSSLGVSSPAPQTTSITSAAATTLAPAPSAIVCRSVTFWRHGHRITVRVCHRVHRDPK